MDPASLTVRGECHHCDPAVFPTKTAVHGWLEKFKVGDPVKVRKGCYPRGCPDCATRKGRTL